MTLCSGAKCLGFREPNLRNPNTIAVQARRERERERERKQKDIYIYVYIHQHSQMCVHAYEYLIYGNHLLSSPACLPCRPTVETLSLDGVGALCLLTLVLPGLGFRLQTDIWALRKVRVHGFWVWHSSKRTGIPTRGYKIWEWLPHQKARAGVSGLGTRLKGLGVQTASLATLWLGGCPHPVTNYNKGNLLRAISVLLSNCY